jgi:ATP:ADP antiporter, AAA family
MANPLKAVMLVRRDEMPLALLMFGYFFLVITIFWTLKPIKSSLFLEYYHQSGFTFLSTVFDAAQAELLAKVLNMFVAILGVAAFTALSSRFRRQRLAYVFAGFFLVCFALYTLDIDSPAPATVWTFYLLGDLWATVMVVTFFAFLNDSVSPEGAKRMYGLIVLGGVVGGAFGSTFVRVWIGTLPVSDWLWICSGGVVALAVLAALAGRLVERNPPPERPQPEERPADAGNPALQGARLVFRSPYLLAIVTIVGLYEITSQVLDFQFKSTITHYLSGPDIGTHLATVFALTNWVSLLVQFFLVGLVMSRLGLTVALLVLPVAIGLGSAGFMALPILWAGSLLNTADNGLAYSMNQSAKEALYVPTTRDEKYKAKAFIDMFVQRFAKVVAIGVSLAVSTYFRSFSSIRWLSIFTLVVVFVWMLAARYAGQRFGPLSEEVGR